MKNQYKAFAIGWLLPVALLAGSGTVGAVAPAWERPAPSTRRAEQAVLLHITNSGTRLIAVGERGLILRSDDSGKHWSQVQSPVSVTLTKVFFVTPLIGWAVGHSGVILHTTDGGLHWIRQLDGIQLARIATQYYQSDSNDPSFGQQVAGARQLQQDGADKPFTDLFFTDVRNGYVIGAYGLILRTEDGGQHWTPMMERLQNPQGLHLYGIARSGNVLFIAGEQGLLLRSADAGHSFVQVATPYKGSYFGLLPLDGGDLYLYGLRGHILRSSNVGGEWQQITVPADVNISSGLALSSTEALFINQAGQLFKSTSTGALKIVESIPRAPYTAITRTHDGAWVLTSMRGVIRISSGVQAKVSYEAKK